MDVYLLTIILFLPLFGAGSLWAHSLVWLHRVPIDKIRGQYKWIALGFSMATFALSLLLLRFDSSKIGPQFEINIPWIESLGARYHLGVDGISLWLVLLTTFLTPICILVTWRVGNNVRAYLTTILLLELGVIGVFVSFDMLLFYLFFELTLIPAGFLIGVWGAERERRVRATVKFFIFTVIGSLFMLVGIIIVFYYVGIGTFDIVETVRALNEARAAGKTVFPGMLEYWLWLAFSVAFFIKIPLWPFHGWQPEAYVQAPTSGSIMMAGVMSKMGAYGLIRFSLSFFPVASAKVAPLVMTLAIVGTIYGALVATIQNDLKKLVAYSSLSHLGLVVLGIFAGTELSLQGALYQMVNHGLSTGALFVCVGLITQRRQTREITEYGGVATHMPGYSTAFMIIAFSSLGLPLLSGFIGEILILIGTFTSPVALSRFFAVIGTSGVVLSAIYILRKMQHVLFGAASKEDNKQLEDLTRRERIALIPMVVMAVVMGVSPMLFINSTKTTIGIVRNSIVQRNTR